MKRVVIYTRVSSTSDRQNNDRQINDLSAYAQANSMEVVKVFNEKISGATKNANREILNDCFDFAKNSGVEVILFSELSRLGRCVLNVIESVKYLSDNGINAYFQKENLTLLDNRGKVQPTTTILISCLGMVAEIERENIKFRLNSGRQQAIERGVKMGRKTGSKENIINKEIKYPVSLKYIRKGYKLTEVLDLAKSRGEKVSMATLKRLKQEIKQGRA